MLLLSSNHQLLQWLESHLLSCPFKRLTSLDCPGCGFQRSVLSILKGNFIESFKFYPATIPFFALIVFVFLHLKFNFKNGAFFIKILYIFISMIIVINYIYKIKTHQLH
ncbi:DUF2752 domain-containing protein [Pedobacter montanisoli]|uniref:DUF2752 domain-containing protein n=1 Tax=Pedobacter montanisoli TaxID=2923277 RepID=A0ABS9ZRA2_9SPHI|nr:DUF2752 domain-containing protein [Pedobacter montanisoli]MCJ0741126.1 DUF2752 domain-containing protein [Pedobacter montanisoli]